MFAEEVHREEMWELGQFGVRPFYFFRVDRDTVWGPRPHPARVPGVGVGCGVRPGTVLRSYPLNGTHNLAVSAILLCCTVRFEN